MTASVAPRRVLLTGAGGFIGSHCIAPLRARGYDVIATYHAHSPAPVEGVQWLKADLMDPGAIGLLVEQARASQLLHLAWYVEPGKLIEAPVNLAWCGASIELLRRFHAAGGERVVMAGSCYEYDWRYGYCNEQLTPRCPDTLYGAAKLGLSEIMLGYCKSTGLSAGWGRMFFLYGPNENPRRLVPAVIQSLLKGEPAQTSHGRQVRDYCHVQDVADGLVALLDSSARGAYNIANGQPGSIVSIVQTLGDIIGRSELLRIGAIPARANDAFLVAADTAAAKRDFGWEARIPLREGLEATVDWWRHELVRQAEQSR
jgi:nucleoside-diphosphate-sugar epimerase